MNNWTRTPTSTALAQGDRLGLRVYIDDGNGVTMTASGRSVTLNLGGGTTGANGDSYVQTTENPTEITVVTAGETGAGADVALVDKTVTAAESGAGSEAQSVGVTAGESGAGGDSASAAPVTPKAIVFNGTSQYGTLTLPNSSPFTSLAGFQILMRVRGSNAAGRLLDFNGVFTVEDIGSGIYAVADGRDGTSNLHNTAASAGADQIFRIQFDPANSRWTSESWSPDGSNYASEQFSITNTANFNWGGGALGVGANRFGLALAGAKIDWLRWIARVETPANSVPSNTPPAGVTWLGDWEFDDNGSDSQAVAGNLTLTGSPSFEDTPGSTDKSASEAGAGTEGSSLAVAVGPASEVGAGSEGLGIGLTGGAETGGGAAAAAVSVTVSPGETGVGAEGLSTAAQVSGSEAGAGADSAGAAAQVAAGEAGAGTEGAAAADAGTEVSAGETGVGSEAQTLNVSLSANEQGGGESQTVDAQVVAAEAGVGADDAGAIQGGNPSVSEAGAGLESATATIALTSAESGAGVDAPDSSQSVTALESGAGSDGMLSGAQASADEAGAGSEGRTATAQAVVDEQGAGGGSAQVQAAAGAVGESSLGVEGGAAGALVFGHEPGAGADFAVPFIDLTAGESAPGAEGYIAFAGLAAAESGAGYETVSAAPAQVVFIHGSTRAVTEGGRTQAAVGGGQFSASLDSDGRTQAEVS